MSPLSDKLSCFWANQSLLFLLNAVCLAEKQQIPIFFNSLWFDPFGARTHNHYTTDAIWKKKKSGQIFIKSKTLTQEMKIQRFKICVNNIQNLKEIPYRMYILVTFYNQYF
jgi:hypothetical protein